MGDTHATGGEGASNVKVGRFSAAPTTRFGWWSVYLALICVVLMVLNTTVFESSGETARWQEIILPIVGLGSVGMGLAGLVVGIVAIVRRAERSWMIWLALVPGALLALFLVGEFTILE